MANSSSSSSSLGHSSSSSSASGLSSDSTEVMNSYSSFSSSSSNSGYLSSSSSSSSSTEREWTVLYESDSYLITTENQTNKFKYVGNNQTYCTIIIEEEQFSFNVFNNNNVFIWDYNRSNKTLAEAQSINVNSDNYVYKITFVNSGSLYFTVERTTAIREDGTVVPMASRQYGEGRIFVHTDRIGGLFTGHGINPSQFWRKVFEWTSNKSKNKLIKIGLIANVIPHAASRINSFNPISVKILNIYDLTTKDLSNFDCLYFVGLPASITDSNCEKIREYVEDGGGLILEYPNRGSEYINILSRIENLYCYSDERLNSSYAYWTIDGQNSYVFHNNINVSFMSTLRKIDFSDNWNILMTNIEYFPTTTTTTSLQDIYNFDKNESSEFIISYYSAMQNGIVEIETS